MISVGRIHLLLALHEQGTLYAAASRLHVSPSAASQQLATLAREAGAPLTEADGRKLRLTDAGRVLVDHGYALLAQLERTEGDVQATLDGELGRITVGSYPSTISCLMIPAARLLRDRHSRIDVDIREVKLPEYLDDLSSGELDVVVAVDADGTSTDADPRFTRVPLGSDEFMLVVPASHPTIAKTPVELSRMADETWISTADGDACDELIRRACASAGFRPRIRHRASDLHAILALIDAGMGVSLLPRILEPQVPPTLACLESTGHQTRRHIHAVTRRGAEHRPAIARYLDALTSVAAQMPEICPAD